jgi:hypothetical protein
LQHLQKGVKGITYIFSTWEAYRKQRNLVTKLKRKSINTYFQERCTGGQKSKHFYTTVKPFLSKKSTGSQQKIVLVENDKIVNNTKDICDTFNTFFVNVADDIGKDVIFNGNSHPSILRIKNNTQHNTLFVSDRRTIGLSDYRSGPLLTWLEKHWF